MSIPIQVPQLGESIVQATIGSILAPSDKVVREGEELLELETEKVNQVLYAPASGKLTLTVKTGDTVRIGQTIGSLDPSVKPSAAPPAPPKASSPPSPPSSLPGVRIMPDALLKAPLPEAPRPSPNILSGASEKVDSPLPEAPRPASAPTPTPASEGRTVRRKMTKLRRVIAERLVEVKNQTAMLTTFNEVDMSAVIAVREKEQASFQERHGVKLGFMSFFIKAAVAALQEFPDINGRIEGDEIVENHFFDIGVAVSTDKGLMVPVLRDVEKLSYADIEKQLKAYAEKARNGTIAMSDLQGGTFTITNGGVFGSLVSTPILNPPQSGILGMHSIVKRPVVIGEEIVVRPMMYLALSYDHRIVDGKEAIGFLVHIKKNLEEPARLLLDL